MTRIQNIKIIKLVMYVMIKDSVRALWQRPDKTRWVRIPSSAHNKPSRFSGDGK